MPLPLTKGLQVQHLHTHGLGPFNFTLAPGECLCLYGPSGSGKTLLLRAIADLDPHQGLTFWKGQAQFTVPAPYWRHQVAYLAAENSWWAETVGSHFPEQELPGLSALGFNASILAAKVSRLSTGERQRLALLRLLLGKPSCLLLDEPTASLDPANVHKVETLLENYRKQQSASLLWVSHDPAQRQRVATRSISMVTDLGITP